MTNLSEEMGLDSSGFVKEKVKKKKAKQDTNKEKETE
jgi:hypothetical protein